MTFLIKIKVFTSLLKMPKALVFAATGFEPMELVVTVDFLRRAGIEVTVAAIGPKLDVDGAHGITVRADALLKDVQKQSYDLLVCPGGMPGTKNLAKDATVVDLVKKQFSSGKLCGAICAAPGFVFAEACGIMKGKKGCGYPGCDKAIETTGGTLLTDDVVVDGNVITARGPAVASKFALSLITTLCGKAKADEVAKGAIYH